MLLNVIYVRPDTLPGRVNGQRDMLLVPAEPAPSVYTQKVQASLLNQGAYAQPSYATDKVIGTMQAVPVYPAAIIATAKSTATLTNQGIYLQ